MAAKQCAAEGCRRRVRNDRAQYCDDSRCVRARERRRKADYRARGTSSPAADPPVEDETPRRQGNVFAATLTELQEAGRLDTAAGQAALALASRIDFGFMDSGSSIAALSKEHAARLAEATSNVHTESDAIDELKARRVRRGA